MLCDLASLSQYLVYNEQDGPPGMTSIAPISQQIWDMKYRLKAADGEPVDRTIEESWQRVARSLAAVEKDQEAWTELFSQLNVSVHELPIGFNLRWHEIMSHAERCKVHVSHGRLDPRSGTLLRAITKHNRSCQYAAQGVGLGA